MGSYQFKKPYTCVNGTETLQSWKFQFEWSKQFFSKYTKTPKFAFTFTKMAHENLNVLNSNKQCLKNRLKTDVDNDLVEYLKYLYKSKILDNTIVFLFSDHGSRFGPMRATLQGKLEERLPLQIVSLPKSFVNKYPT